MNQILINDNYKAFGEMSVKQYKSGGSIIVEGILQLNQYFDDIQTIQTDSFLVTGVDVQSEAFGTNDTNIIYTFIAKALNINIKLLNKSLLEKQEGEINE